MIVLDTETTGYEGSLVEIALVDPDSWEYAHTLLRPTCPISYGAMATHHITEDMVADAPTLEQWRERGMDKGVLRLSEYGDDAVGMLSQTQTLVAHNMAFDIEFLPEDVQDFPRICTWRCANHLFPNAESHSNQALRYELGLDVSDIPQEAGGLPHRALYDAWCTAKLLRYMVCHLRNESTNYDSDDEAIRKLIELTSSPFLLREVKFGKHRGEGWSDVPKSYLRWVLNQDFDEDIKHTARHWL